jgi:hypothetical protein
MSTVDILSVISRNFYERTRGTYITNNVIELSLILLLMLLLIGKLILSLLSGAACLVSLGKCYYYINLCCHQYYLIMLSLC